MQSEIDNNWKGPKCLDPGYVWVGGALSEQTLSKGEHQDVTGNMEIFSAVIDENSRQWGAQLNIAGVSRLAT